MDQFLKNYKFVNEFDSTADVPADLIDSLLKRTWSVTPSKNNFMPYSVNVIGPDKQSLKEKIYKKCLETEINEGGNSTKISTIRKQKNASYHNITSCSYLLLFTQRVETQLNEFQKKLLLRGFTFEQMLESKLDAAKHNALIEVGMFCSTFGSLCLENNLDISYILCFPTNKSAWEDDDDFDFIKSRSLLIMLVGKGKIYRQDELKKAGQHGTDHKPNYERIVNFIE